jgi:hypothetical protein
MGESRDFECIGITAAVAVLGQLLGLGGLLGGLVESVVYSVVY